MIELNPHRRTARTFAFLCYVLAGFVFVAGVFFTIVAATVDLAQLPMKDVTNDRMAVMMGSIFVILVVVIASFGWRVQRLFGQQRREDKLAAKSAIGCLRLGSLGCGLWAMPSAATILLTHQILATGEPAGLRELFVGASGFIIAVVLMLSVAWFIAANYTTLNAEDRKRALNSYVGNIRSCLHQLSDPEVRTYAQERTLEVLTKLDVPLKGTLLGFLSEAGLLTGNSRVRLDGADFRCVDLRSINLPEADLEGINFEQATLQGASLFKANLQSANLKNADLSRANLQEADLRYADLTGAILNGTNLSRATLAEAKVAPMQLEQARMKN